MNRLFILGLLAGGIMPAASSESGVVRSAGQPIPGAAVTASQGTQKLSAITNESGHYQLDLPTPGVWQIQVEMFGFAPAQREINADTGPSPLDFNLQLKARPAAGPRGAAGRTGGFQNVTLNQSTENQVTEALNSTPPAAVPESANANEAFLVSGSVSQGLAAAQQEDAFALRRPEGGDSPFGGRGGGQQAFGGGVPGAGGPGGGFGGGFGGRGGGGFGGGGGGGGGPRGRVGNRPDRAMGPTSFGNRANRNRGGIRGALFFTIGNSALDARPFSLTGQTVAKPSYSSARFGLTAGGQLNIPKLIHSDKTFFFVNYFGTRSKSPFSAVATVPTELERQGFFSTPIYDPSTHAPFFGNSIPLNLLNKASLGLLPLIPLPNQPGDVQNYQFITSVPQNTDNFNIRLNHTLSAKNRLDLNLNLQNRDSRAAQTYGFTDETSGFGLSSTLGWTHTFPHQIFNSLRWSFSRNRSNTLPFFAYTQDLAAQLGIQGVSHDPINYGPPNLSFTNFGALSDASPLLRRDQTSGVVESVNMVRGRHSLNFGGEFRRQQLNQLTDQNGRGSFTFSGLATSAFDAKGQPIPGTGFDFADFLLGLPQSSSVRFGTNSTYFRGSVYNLFTTEEWRARPNLTFNLGLRWEYFTPLSEKYNRIANLDIAPDFTAVAVVVPGQAGPYSGAFPAGLINPDKHNFSPRLGVAWRPFAKRQTLVRAGYSIFYNGAIYSQFPSRLASQPPFANTASLVTSLAHPITIQNGFGASPSETITNTYAVDRSYLMGYAQTWNFSIQHPFTRSFVMEVGYLGTKGTHLDIQSMPNRAAPGSPLTAEQRRQIGNAQGFTFESSNGNSIYHAMQVRVTRRFVKGISANALYTFSKSIDNASTIGGGAAVVAQNSLDLHAERGLSSFDQRHTLNVFYILTSPVGEQGLLRGAGWPQRLLKDWTLSGGVTATSGTPFTARVLGNQSDTGGTGSVGSGRADATGLPIESGSGYFNPLAFTIPVPGTFGDAARNTIPGIPRFSMNLSFARAFKLDERRRIEFRVDSQNFLNHVGITGINTVINASNYGLPLAAASMRTVTATARLRF